MEEQKLINYLLKSIIKIAFALCRVNQLAKQSNSKLWKILKGNLHKSNSQFLKIQLAYCIKYKQWSQSKTGENPSPKAFWTSLSYQ